MAFKIKRRAKGDTGGLLVHHGQPQWLNIFILCCLIGGVVWLVRGHQSQPTTTAKAQPAVTTHAGFIKKLAPSAQRMQKKYHVLASISLSQAILESDWGQSTNATKNYNLFGVKATAAEPGKLMMTKEYYDGAYHQVKQRFRVYSSWDASMVGHAKRLANGPSWDATHYQAVIQAKDYQTAARALVTAGYATDPNYDQKLINIIQKYNLQRYDK
ncbi:cell wall hydrolase [Lactobacillus sp. CBA3606]|uniref:glycoside hydrolase family 73 protein n=1 Tax=Lactobacillus sp. CBA3606 TaxID=2099789 RepID=UPI000CFCFC45|nr:glycoside hydrolase family 73 protein [Lactobacillus sp. CBA3606]AVK62670.1 cell wall hydrolase [Lactobacillus sp. CBA3606]